MIELIISLLLAIGINTSNSESGVIVIDQQTGIVFGVGSTVGNTQSGTNTNPTPIYYLIQDANGEYHLVRK